MQQFVAGVDSSTQSCKVVIRDLHTGKLVRSGAVGVYVERLARCRHVSSGAQHEPC